LKKFFKNSKKEVMHLFKSRLMIRTSGFHEKMKIVPLVNMKEGEGGGGGDVINFLSTGKNNQLVHW